MLSVPFMQSIKLNTCHLCHVLFIKNVPALKHGSLYTYMYMYFIYMRMHVQEYLSLVFLSSSLLPSLDQVGQSYNLLAMLVVAGAG